MKVKAHARYIRQSPYKVRRVLDLVRGMPVEDARDVLMFTNRRAAETIRKVLDSAVASAEHNYALDADELFVDQAFADDSVRGIPAFQDFTAALAKRFTVRGIDVETALKVHLLEPSHQDDVSLLVDIAHVPRVQPSVDDGLGGLYGFFPVLNHGGAALQNDFAGNALFHIAAVLVEGVMNSKA